MAQISSQISSIQFYLKIYDLWTHSPPLGGSVGGFMSN